jgi:hypothetical protein
MRLSLGYIRIFLFPGCIKISHWVTRYYLAGGDWVADRLGVTAAQADRELRRPGDLVLEHNRYFDTCFYFIRRDVATAPTPGMPRPQTGKYLSPIG